MEDLRRQAAMDGSLEDLFLKITEEVGDEGAPVTTGDLAG
jgi:hypothetical protein